MQIHELVATCGLICAGCPIYWATQEKEHGKKVKMRKAIGHIMKEQYGSDVDIEEITDCDGCRTAGGRLFFGCKNCEIRACACERDLKSCAFCTEYSCEKLQKFFGTDPEAKKRLEMIRNILYGME